MKKCSKQYVVLRYYSHIAQSQSECEDMQDLDDIRNPSAHLIELIVGTQYRILPPACCIIHSLYLAAVSIETALSLHRRHSARLDASQNLKVRDIMHTTPRFAVVLLVLGGGVLTSRVPVTDCLRDQLSVKRD